jgi:heme A synthase
LKKSALLKIVNPLLILLFITQALTGILHDVIMEVSYETFEIIHGIGGYVFVFLVVCHFILNWSWIKNTFFKSTT